MSLNWRIPSDSNKQQGQVGGSNAPRRNWRSDANRPRTGSVKSNEGESSFQTRENSQQQRENLQTRLVNHHGNNSNFRSRRQNTNQSEDNSRSRYSRNVRGPRFGFRMLQALSEKDTEAILEDLKSERSQKELVIHLQEDLDNDYYILIINIFSKISESSFKVLKRQIFQIYLNQKFMKRLVNYITNLPLQDQNDKRRNRLFWENSDGFWYNLIKISESILNELPHFGYTILPLLMRALAMVLPLFETQHNVHIADNIHDSIEKLNKRLDVVCKEIEDKKKLEEDFKNLQIVDSDQQQEPPNDFHEIDIYPTYDELVNEEKSFLRENVIKGSYRDVNHYLDVQFRLLREDFIAPLRKGIQMYFDNQDKKNEKPRRLENIKIHKRVQFLNAEIVSGDKSFRLKFDFNTKAKKKTNSNYKYSKSFMFGSLLCFTCDNFKTLSFGKVTKRELKDLEQGEVIVGFSNETCNINFNVDYLMVEYNVYFEPYFHVLNRLKEINVKSFPMEKYIIRTEKDVESPQYLKNRLITDNIKAATIMNNLNESQRVAFRAALNQEIVIIQGPPGTGKTHLALKIANVLIHQREFWFHKTPMLVICFTNHALDQFLEGIAHFTDNIIRVGGQSKNPNLNKFNLKEIKTRRHLSSAYYDVRNTVKELLIQIKGLTETLRIINKFEGIADISVVQQVANDQIIDWLAGGTKSIRTYKVVNITPTNDHSDEDTSDEENDDDNSKILLDDLYYITGSSTISMIYSTKMNEKSIRDLKRILDELNSIENPNTGVFIQIENVTKELRNHIIYDEVISTRLRYCYENNVSLDDYKDFTIDFKDPYVLTLDQRWNVYLHSLYKFRVSLINKINRLNARLRENTQILDELQNIEDTKVMKEALVIGMTTTCAARLKSVLDVLKCPIVIVEEAAEVLEAHITAVLTEHCQHLILIGDHQQLKPSTADYSIEKKYKLGISLFERMVINGIQCFTLNVQHRMKPEIAALISPTIYPDLKNHNSVLQRERIRGIDTCLYFIDHQHPEDESMETSKRNLHEVDFLLKFARHLILNGYQAENVTILAAYLGQMFEMQKRRKNDHLLEGIRIAVLDNYQGEESDIILLSLVRNNYENKIGFLKIENRVCVALSRARDGLYIMGNMQQLCSGGPEIWPAINKTLQDSNNIGKSLPLRCEIHKDKVTHVKSAKDFFAISEGGCDQICNFLLVCGHLCQTLCHVLNRDHANYMCHQLCGKKLCDKDERHTCKKMCYEECGKCSYKVERILPCDHLVVMECHEDPFTFKCPVLVTTTLPCGHSTEKPCHRDETTFPCPFPCESIVDPCGHACRLKCHLRRDPDHIEYRCTKPCARYGKGCTVRDEKHLCPKLCYEECSECTIKVRKHRSVCPHVYDVECHYDVDQLECIKPCSKLLECGHKCKSKCNENCTVQCMVVITKTNPVCNHSITVKCYQEPDRKLCKKDCPLQLPCGHKCTKKCNENCTTRCKVLVEVHNKQLPCGHLIHKLPCYLKDSSDNSKLEKYCQEPCSTTLECGHKCSGSCGECNQGRVHVPCTSKCGAILICNHECKTPCREVCQPCTLPCSFKCAHSKCRKKCGQVCTPCREQCTRGCPHRRCTKWCSELCNIDACKEFCKKLLKCQHPCVGFCGEPCPTCIVCNRDEMLEVFFGTEDENARYVVLEDCGHVFESTGLDQWMDQSDEITFKSCPRCKTVVKTSERYANQIKQAMLNVIKVKEQYNGNAETNEAERLDLETKITTLIAFFTKYSNVIVCPKLFCLLERLRDRLRTVNNGKRQHFNKYILKGILAKIQILENIQTFYEKNSFNFKLQSQSTNKNICKDQTEFIAMALLSPNEIISNQQIKDVNLELDRLIRMIQLERIKALPTFSYKKFTNPKVATLVEHITVTLVNTQRYSKNIDEKIKVLLTDLKKETSSIIAISDQERKEIVQAIGLKPGHWYKCRNGHPYIITECGGAMEKSTCNECGAPIGGENHTLDSTNAVATEMDGARYAAWGNMANLANFDLANLR